MEAANDLGRDRQKCRAPKHQYTNHLSIRNAEAHRQLYLDLCVYLELELLVWRALDTPNNQYHSGLLTYYKSMWSASASPYSRPNLKLMAVEKKAYRLSGEFESTISTVFQGTRI